jgi:hypothetical protein
MESVPHIQTTFLVMSRLTTDEDLPHRSINHAKIKSTSVSPYIDVTYLGLEPRHPCLTTTCVFNSSKVSYPFPRPTNPDNTELSLLHNLSFALF